MSLAGEFETHPRKRYGLDGVTLWPRVELLLADGERETVSEAQTNFTFFVNGAVVLALVALLLLVDRIAHATSDSAAALQSIAVAASGLLLCWGAYRGAVSAVGEWGDSVRAAFDVHRLDVYAKLGVKAPESPEEEEAIARAVNRCLLFAEPIPAEYRAIPPPTPEPRA